MQIWMCANPCCEECNSQTNRRRKKTTGNTQKPTICAFFYPCFITIRKDMKNILFVMHIQVQIHQGQEQGGGSGLDPSLY